METLNARKRQLQGQLRELDGELLTLRQERAALNAQLASLKTNSASESAQMAQLGLRAQNEDGQTLRRSSAKYLAPENHLDDGELKLFWDRLVFSGWRGNLVMSLSEVSQIRSGQSTLPLRAGVPLIQKWFPGREVLGGTLLLDLISPDGVRTRAVLAALTETQWPSLVEESKARLPELTLARSVNVEAQLAATQRKAAVDAEIADIESSLRKVTERGQRLVRARDQHERELALPDWEHRTVQLKGRNLSQQLDRTLKATSPGGWELVSTASPRKDEMVVTLKRPRPV